MPLLLADTFTSSLARLTGDEQKAVKTTAFDLQMNPASPGMKFHRLEKAKDRNFWSVRVSSDIRLIVHKTDDSLLLCYVDHHDAAYAWAERRKIEVHPSTGAAQLVEIRETVREIEIPRYVEAADRSVAKPAQPRVFDVTPDDVLLSYGVPPEWLADVRQATEDTLLDLVGHLPGEAAEALLTVATGGTVTKEPALTAFSVKPGEPIGRVGAFAHPEAQRRFRVMDSVEDLQRALDAPWEAWTVFLHPAQRTLVDRHFNGPARVAGSAGTGKTVVALHRAAKLAQHPYSRVLLATFNDTLAGALRVKLRTLVGADSPVFSRIVVSTVDQAALSLLAMMGPGTDVATIEQGRRAIDAALKVAPQAVSRRMVEGEWRDVVDAWQLTTWPAYRDVKRLGRKTRLAESQRASLWRVFEEIRESLRKAGLVTMAEALARATDIVNYRPQTLFNHIVVDESQDVTVSQLKFLAALLDDRADGLFFAGDLGQRIFQLPFSWKSLGVDLRGRSHILRVNYRTSHQIRRQADRLMGAEVADVDGNVESRTGAVSVFNGPEPEVHLVDSAPAETAAIASWLQARIAEGLRAEEIAVFVRSDAELPRARSAVQAAGLPMRALNASGAHGSAGISVGTMHLAKGLEFRAVVVAACDDDVLPLQSRVEGISDESDLEDVYNTERQLLYVACTRARDQLLVTGVRPGSEFLADMKGQ